MKKYNKLEIIGVVLWLIGVIFLLLKVFSETESIIIEFGHIALYIGLGIWVLGIMLKKKQRRTKQ